LDIEKKYTGQMITR